MKEKWQKVLNITTFILLIVCIVKIVSIEDKLSALKNTVNNNHSMLQNSIGTISSNIRYELEQQASLVIDSGWSTKDLNLEEKTVTLDCYVIPKTYNPQKTTASILCNGTEIPLTLENNRYTAEIKLFLSEEYNISNVSFTEDGTISTHQLNWRISPADDLVPTAYMSFSGSSRHSCSGKNIKRTYEGYVEIDLVHKGFNTKIKQAELTVIIDGKEALKEQPEIDLLVENEYTDMYRFYVNNSFDITSGSTIEMYVDVIDNNGWRYHTILENILITKDGSPQHISPYNAYADIYDSDNNLIFKGSEF